LLTPWTLSFGFVCAETVAARARSRMLSERFMVRAS